MIEFNEPKSRPSLLVVWISAICKYCFLQNNNLLSKHRHCVDTKVRDGRWEVWVLLPAGTWQLSLQDSTEAGYGSPQAFYPTCAVDLIPRKQKRRRVKLTHQLHLVIRLRMRKPNISIPPYASKSRCLISNMSNSKDTFYLAPQNDCVPWYGRSYTE